MARVTYKPGVLPDPIKLDIKNSSRVSHMEYYPEKTSRGIIVGEMRVTYNSGATYKYSNILKPVFDRIVSASSVGKALQAVVSDKSIKYEKM